MASYLDRLIKMQAESFGEGVTYDPSTGGFLLPNGMFLNMGMYGARADDHRVATAVLTHKQEEKFRSLYDAMVHVAKKIGMYRWMPEAWALETWTEPTRAQLDTIGELAKARPISIEAWKGRSYYAKQYEEWDAEQAWRDLYEFYRYGNKPSGTDDLGKWYNPGRKTRRRKNPTKGGSALQLRKLGLDKPIKTKPQARAWLRKLYKSPFAFHLDDPTWDIPSFGAVAANILDRQRNKARKLLGYEEMWEVYYPSKENPSKASMERASMEITMYDAIRSIKWLLREYGAKEFQQGMTLEDIRSGMDRPHALTANLAEMAIDVYRKATGYTLLKYKPYKAKKTKKNPVDYRKPKPKKGPGGWTSFWHEGHRVYVKKHKGHELAAMRGEGTMWYAFKDDRELGHYNTLKKAKAAAMAAVRK